MAQRNNTKAAVYACAAIFMALTREPLQADEAADTGQQLLRLEQQNQALQEQLRQQQGLIESLTRKINKIEESTGRSGSQGESKPDATEPEAAYKKPATFGLGRVNISGEGGVAFFNTGSEGIFPNAEFRVDEAKLFVEAPVWGDVYFFSELNLMTREASDLSLQLGELYLDFENVSQLWNRDRMLNLRVGQMY